jgi:DNA-directed RNA polymerase subunit alpha
MSEIEKIEIHTTLTFVYKNEEKHEKKETDPVLLRPIQDLELTLRTTRCLLDVGVKTIGDITKKTESDLRRVAGLGLRSQNEIKNILISRGLELKSPA